MELNVDLKLQMPKLYSIADIINYYRARCSHVQRVTSRTVWRTSNGCVASSAAEQTWTCGMTPIAVDCRPRSRCSPCQMGRHRNVRLLSASIRHPKRPGNLPPSPAWPSRSLPWISCKRYWHHCNCDPGPEGKEFIHAFHVLVIYIHIYIAV